MTFKRRYSPSEEVYMTKEHSVMKIDNANDDSIPFMKSIRNMERRRAQTEQILMPKRQPLGKLGLLIFQTMNLGDRARKY